MSSRRYLPGGGFVLLVASWGGLAAFLAWGMREPDLDRVWRILARADRGSVELSAEDAEVLARSIERHPELALDRLGGKRQKHLARTSGGWSTAPVSYFLALRSAGGALRVGLEARGATRWPLAVDVEAGGAACRLEFEGEGVRECALSSAAAGGEGAPVLGRLVVHGAFRAPADGKGAGLRFVEPGGGGPS